jgi:hypothetical protein
MFLFLVLLLSSCETKKDPIIGSNFKELDQKDFLEVLSKGKSLEVVYVKDDFYDTLYMFKINSDENLKSVLWINPEEYHFDKVNSVKINFGSDSVMFFGQMDFRPGKGLVEKSKLDEIISIYTSYFGEPTISLQRYDEELSSIQDVITAYKDKVENSNSSSDNLSNARSLLFPPELIYYNNYKVWKLIDYNVMIHHKINLADSSKIFGFVKYEVRDLANILAEKREEIRRNASLNDYITMDLNLNPFTKSTRQFYTDKFQIVSYRLGHNLAEESRNIKQFKFDLFIDDEYGDNILMLKDMELSLDYPLEAPRNGSFTLNTNGFQWTVEYNRNSSYSRDYEKLRQLMDRKIELGRLNDIKLRYEITALIFEDGEVLKK